MNPSELAASLFIGQALQAFKDRHVGRAARAYARSTARRAQRARLMRRPQDLKVGDVLADGGVVDAVAMECKWRVVTRVVYDNRGAREVQHVRWRTCETAFLKGRR